MLISSVAIAQKHNIVNASIALRNAKKATGDEIGTLLSEAKDYIDLAYSNESTSNEAKGLPTSFMIMATFEEKPH